MSDLEDGIDTLQETETILTESHDAVKADIGKTWCTYLKTKLFRIFKTLFRMDTENLIMLRKTCI